MSVDAEALLEQFLAIAKRDADEMQGTEGALLPEQASTLQGYIRVLTAYVRGARKEATSEDDMEALLEQVKRDPMLMEELRK